MFVETARLCHHVHVTNAPQASSMLFSLFSLFSLALSLSLSLPPFPLLSFLKSLFGIHQTDVTYKRVVLHASTMLTLHAHHADVNIQNEKTGWTPMHAAAFQEHGRCVELLLNAGARHNLADSNGKEKACCKCECSFEILETCCTRPGKKTTPDSKHYFLSLSLSLSLSRCLYIYMCVCLSVCLCACQIASFFFYCQQITQPHRALS